MDFQPQNIQSLAPDEQHAELSSLSCEDSDLCKQVRELVKADFLDGKSLAEMNNIGVIQPVEGDSMFVKGREDNYAAHIFDTDAVELIHLQRSFIGVERFQATKERDRTNIAEHDYKSISPSVQYIKELLTDPSVNSFEEFKKNIKKDGVIQERMLLIRAEPVYTETWAWFEERSEWVYLVSNTARPDCSTNPFWLYNQGIVDVHVKQRGIGSVERLLEFTVKAFWEDPECYELDKMWPKGCMKFGSFDVMVGVVENIAYNCVLGLQDSSFERRQAGRTAYEKHGKNIMGGVAMFKGLLDDRGHFDKAFSRHSEQGRDRAYGLLCRRVKRLERLMQEVEKLHGTESGTNN